MNTQLMEVSDYRLRILHEHAEFLQALITIDDLLDKMQHVTEFEQAMELASQINDVIPKSIVATRHERYEAG
jgi:Zn-dependent oligopeptidase